MSVTECCPRCWYGSPVVGRADRLCEDCGRVDDLEAEVRMLRGLIKLARGWLPHVTALANRIDTILGAEKE